MTTLDAHVRVASRYARSANLERDAQAGDALDGYVLTGRVLEMLDRITARAIVGGGGAWSITGPYGCGKSSLGVFLDALFGPNTSASFALAHKLVLDVDADLAERILYARQRCDSKGFVRSLVTAHHEPITHTFTRALDRTVRQWFGRTPTTRQFAEIQLLAAALDDLASDDPRRTGPAPGSLVEVAIALAAQAPLLIVIDEFGKNLEAAQQRAHADLYLLQLLAEASQSARGRPIMLLTMQHLAFGEYAEAAESAQQREWAKIQGRFEDVLFADSAAQTRQLVANAFTTDPALSPRVAAWAADQARRLADLNLYELADAVLLADCYPLDPLTLGVLPDLCRRYGQNERTLFGFLTGTHQHAAPALMAQRAVTEPLPTIGLADVYDFFAQVSTITATASTTRWSEIVLRLRDLGGFTTEQLAVAKTIAVLNLVATSGPLRASHAVVSSTAPGAEQHIASLVAAGAIVYRDTSDEYRVWQGSGVNLSDVVERSRLASAQRSPVTLLSAAAPLEPVVATGHSMRTDTLRTFERLYVRDMSEIAAAPAGMMYDGRVYLAVDPNITIPASAPAGLPVIVHVPTSTTDLLAAAREVHALQLALVDPSVNDDWVARAEIRERLATAHQVLRSELDRTEAAGTWYLLGVHGPIELENGPGSAALSAAADRCYPQAIAVRNETLNRVELSSQGAKARRLLLLAMLDHEELPRLGLIGHGPEVAMYTAMLQHTGIHRFDPKHERWALRPPGRDHDVAHAWKAIDEQLRRATDRRVSLNDIHAALQLPPIGVKAGPIPVLVTAVLIATSDEVAVYEHGTFRPVITEEVCDRMVRNPGHFEVKHYANATGARRKVIAALAERFNLAPRYRKQRVANVLAIVSELVTRIANVPPHTVRATNLSEPAAAVRDAIVRATEPDELLFHTLPVAVGLNPISPRLDNWRHTATYSDRLVAALTELDDHYSLTLAELTDELIQRSREPGRRAIAAQAQVLEGEVINPDIRSFVLALGSDSFDDRHWIENIATVVSRSAPRNWTMDDRVRFSSDLAGNLASFRRLLILHSEIRGLDAQPFAAHRITLTTSTGHEDAVIVALDEDSRTTIASRAEALLDELTAAFGSRHRAETTLLGWVAERVFPNTVVPLDQNETRSISKAVNDV